MPTGEDIRNALLTCISKRSGPSLQSRSVLNEAAQQLSLKHGDLASEQALLTYFHDLFRLGYLAWGYDINNADPPFFHSTDLGRRALAGMSRDPANPDGYLKHLASKATLSPVAASYIKEALSTYNAGCFKATAVMTGAAAEAMALQLAEAVADRMIALSVTVPADLRDWRIKRVLDALSRVLENAQPMPRELGEAFGAYWPAFTQQIRVARNEAGHPVSVDPVTADTVHGSLLIFPELADLAATLTAWVPTANKLSP